MPDHLKCKIIIGGENLIVGAWFLLNLFISSINLHLRYVEGIDTWILLYSTSLKWYNVHIWYYPNEPIYKINRSTIKFSIKGCTDINIITNVLVCGHCVPNLVANLMCIRCFPFLSWFWKSFWNQDNLTFTWIPSAYFSVCSEKGGGWPGCIDVFLQKW